MMISNNGQLHEGITREAIFKGIITELNGFQLPAKEYINLATSILDLATSPQTNTVKPNNNKISKEFNSLPVIFEELKISGLEFKKHKKIISKWIDSEVGRDFIHSRIDDIEFDAEKFFTDNKNIFGLIEADNTPIGLMGFLHYDKKNNKAELRKLIGDPNYRGKGLGKKSTKLWLNYGLNGLKLRKIYLYTYDTNLRNIRINIEMGFQLEGVFKQENIDNDVAKDIIRMAYLA